MPNESVGEFNEPGLSSDKQSEEDILNPDHSQTDTAGIKQSRLETHTYHAPDWQSRAGLGSEKSLPSKPVKYAELEWGNEGVKRKNPQRKSRSCSMPFAGSGCLCCLFSVWKD